MADPHTDTRGAESFDHDPQAGVFTVTVDGTPAGFAEYAETTDGVLDFHHTVIDPAFRGRGLSGKLIAHALVEVRAEGKKIIPSCSAVERFIEKNPDQSDLVA